MWSTLDLISVGFNAVNMIFLLVPICQKTPHLKKLMQNWRCTEAIIVTIKTIQLPII